jgi:hypothetical protein
MTRNQILGTVALTLALGVVASCGEDDPDVLEPGAGGDLFRSYVALGNSLTAGWQSGGINDSTQRESYAYLLAQQAGARFIIPALPRPGCPPPLAEYLNPAGVVGAPAATPRTCTFRSTAVQTGPINDVAVPLAFAWDISRTPPTPTGENNPLQTFILGGKTQIGRARDAEPTFVSLWIGNNDVLAPATVGVFTTVPGASPGIIPPDTITKYIGAAVDTLAALPTVKGGVLIGVVDVPNAPRFFPASALLTDADFKAKLDAAVDAPNANRTVFVHPNCAGSPALVSAVIVEQIKAGAYPPIISCEPNPQFPPGFPPIPPQAQLGDLFILSAAEQQTLSAIVAAVNAFIQTKAEGANFAYYDPNPALAALRASGAIPALPDFTSPTAPFGPNFSLDGVHPRRSIHVAVANALIDIINTKYRTTIPPIPGAAPD